MTPHDYHDTLFDRESFTGSVLSQIPELTGLQ